MPTVVSAVIDDTADSGDADRLEIYVNLTLSDHTSQVVKFHTSHKKHMLYSYVGGDDAYAPTPAAINTIALVNDGLFTTSFRAYVLHMCSKMRGAADYTAFRPSDPAHAMVTPSKGLLWGNDVNRIGGPEIHAYPINSDNAVEFNLADFRHFIKLMTFMYHADAAARRRTIQDATAAWAAIGADVTAAGMFSEGQLLTIRHKLANAETARLAGIDAMREIGQANRAVNQRDDLDDAKPFRSAG